MVEMRLAVSEGILAQADVEDILKFFCRVRCYREHLEK